MIVVFGGRRESGPARDLFLSQHAAAMQAEPIVM